MSIADIRLFLKSIYPFELLTSFQIDRIVDSIDIVYYRDKERIEQTDEYLYIILKGAVVQKNTDGKEISFYGEKDSFDYEEISSSVQEYQFFTLEESILYRVPLSLLRDIIKENQTFARYIQRTTKEKLSSLASQNPYLFARIKDIPIAKPFIVDASTSIRDAVYQMTERSAQSILVKFDDGYGIVTDSDLRKKVILGKIDIETSISSIANRNIVSIKETDFLFDAIITMMKHNIKRIVIKDDSDQIVGMLNEIDILAQYSNQPQFIVLKIEKSKNIEELKSISQSFVNTVRILHKEGIRTRHIMKFVSEINSKIFNKLFSLVAPQSLRLNSCLIVMGSEGREEQILKTDQDNGLILRDDFEYKYLDEFAEDFNQILIELGYPECKGNVMIKNPYWRKTLSEYKQSILEYVDNINSDNMLKLATLVDLKPVAGDETLAENLKKFIFEHICDNKTFLSWFALPTIQFKTPLNIFGGFETEKGKIDIKKGGIFAIIHGVRALAIENRVIKTNTFDRIKELKNKDVFKETFARELIESLEFLLTLRLKERLRKLELKQQPDDLLDINMLSNIEKDLLKESFKIVNKFKDFVINHYRLNYIT